LFSVRTRRRTFELAVDGVASAEIALDESSYLCDASEGDHALTRVEVELEAGADGAAVAPFVGALRAAGSLDPADASKFEVGLRVAGLTPAGALDLGSTEVELAMPIGETAYAVLRGQFAMIQRHEPGTRLGADPEDLHDMRVATRRLRAALSLCRPWLAPQAEYLRVEFGWVARVLGSVRDLDVQIGAIELEPERAALSPLLDLLRAQRNEARERMLVALDSRAFALLLGDLTSMLADAPPDGSPTTATTAPKLIKRRYRRFRALADALTAESPPGDYHALRLRGKRLRYALEFFTSPYGAEAERAVRALQQLQDVLGAHQDAEVAIHQLRELIESDHHALPARTAFAMGALAERQRLGMAETVALVPGLDARLIAELKALRRTMRRARRHAKRAR
jgi:CHAD domain-containing protein